MINYEAERTNEKRNMRLHYSRRNNNNNTKYYPS